jgi:hypothetical protein
MNRVAERERERESEREVDGERENRLKTLNEELVSTAFGMASIYATFRTNALKGNVLC